MSRNAIPALTHDGPFHADEVTAFAVLRLASPGIDAGFVRTRDPALIPRAGIVFDVGGIYAPEAGRYDHHMPEPPRRADGTPYSSAGLIWRDFGRAAIGTLLPHAGADEIDDIWNRIDMAFVLPIDRIDNGLHPPPPLSLATVIDTMNPAWDESGLDEDSLFREAAALVETALRREIRTVHAEIRARSTVLAAATESADPRILELPANMPWQGAVFAAGLPVLYALYRDRGGLWRIDCMPTEPGAFQQRHPLPAGWAGLRDEALQRASGVPDAVFVHPARFTGGARSLDGARAMARLALADTPPPNVP